ncbi:Yip1 family protein [Vitreimonas sp.]|uniref:Yip1 family protein n=1 Tax=Vitreimonas sp. TaxID=3069702 RepID=UPI002ED83014
MTIDPTNAGANGLVDRAKNILLTPKAEWEKIAAEPFDLQKLYTGYVVPLAALAAVCGFIGMSLVGMSAFGISYRVPIVTGIVQAVVQIALSTAMVYVMALVTNALAPNFGSQQDVERAHKLAAYGCTAGFLAGVFAILPPLALLWLVGLYSLYLIYVGLPVMMKTPQDKVIGYVVVIVLVTIVIGVVVNLVLGTILNAVGLGVRPPGAAF